MSNLLVTSKHVRLNVPIPENSKIAVTDVFFENHNYNILNGGLEVVLYAGQGQMSKFLQMDDVPQGYWHVVSFKLMPGYYPNLKEFQKACLSAVSNLSNSAERRIISHLFSRFEVEGGRLKIKQSFHPISTNFIFRIHFTDEKIAEYLGLHEASLFIDRQGMAESHVWAPYMRPYTGPSLKLINFETRVNFTISCEEVDTALSSSKEICTAFFKKQDNTKEYIQPRNITFCNLTNNTHSTLRFNWPEGINLIFFNLSILTDC